MVEEQHLPAVEKVNKMPRISWAFCYIYRMIKQKFYITRKTPAKRIDSMNSIELVRLRDYAIFMANAASYADDGKQRDWWRSVERDCGDRLSGK